MNKFIFVRHGQSVANAKNEIAVDETPLTDTGLGQARATASEVKKFHITTIACSPLLRARQTAEAIAMELGIDAAHIKGIEELKERDLGDLKGKPKQYETQYFYEVDGEQNVESREDTTERMKRCLEKIAALASDSTVLVVGHAVSGYYLLEVAEGREHYSEFEPPQEIMNADFVEVDLSRHRVTVGEE